MRAALSVSSLACVAIAALQPSKTVAITLAIAALLASGAAIVSYLVSEGLLRRQPQSPRRRPTSAQSSERFAKL
jgi:hypothetical protein